MWSILWMCVWGAHAGSYGDTAALAAHWLAQQGTTTPQGLVYPGDLIGQTSLVSYNRTFDLYSGIAGSIVGLLEAYQVDNTKVVYKTQATLGGTYILNHLDTLLKDKANTCLWHAGIAGVGYALHVLGGIVGDTKYTQAAVRIADYIVVEAKGEPSGKSLNPLDGVRWGGAGSGFFLLYMHSQTHTGSYLQLAVDEAVFLASQGRPAHGGLEWESFGRKDFFMPNFAEGTAGICYYIATIAGLTNNTDLMSTAVKGTVYLLNIANKDNDGCMVYHDNIDPSMYYMAECNGPSGLGRLWYRLYQVSGDKVWLNWMMKTSNSLQHYSVYDDTFNWVWHTNKKDPLWKNYGQCDGHAAAVEYAILVYIATNQTSALEYARKVGDDIVKHATPQQGGVMWVTVEWRTSPAQSTAPQVGYMQGAAGIASCLLGLQSAVDHHGVNPHRLILPDSPYAYELFRSALL